MWILLLNQYVLKNLIPSFEVNLSGLARLKHVGMQILKVHCETGYRLIQVATFLVSFFINSFPTLNPFMYKIQQLTSQIKSTRTMIISFVSITLLVDDKYSHHHQTC